MKNFLRFFFIFWLFLSPAHGHEFEQIFRLSNVIPSDCVEFKFPKTKIIGIISNETVKQVTPLPKIAAAGLDERLLVDLSAELRSMVGGTTGQVGKFCRATYGAAITAQLVEVLISSDNIALYETDKEKFISTINVRRIWSGTTIEYIMSVKEESGSTPLLINLNIISHAK
ncbi:hypothetical protein FHW58_005478 [Duganella sp. 1224]|uniref:hypothetical protein n=1 Tax=Duganella sp. 1224 TaxID=2587052 RepID=UPI0015C9BFE9|nr:hypothetical protein [Duganella sp. 1224]NYE64240.1 hypothetical protein [Duganella sp. 1224]